MSHRKISTEFQNFDDTMRKLIQVPHSEIKAQLEAEKRKRERKAKRKPSASEGHASDKKD